jgi:hypothetical protein
MSVFHGGVGFHGYRLGLELLTCLVPALTFSAPYLGRVTRRLVPIVIAVQVAAFTLGAMVEAYFVDVDDVWKDNSFWLALRYNPGVVGGMLAIFVAIGLLVAIRYIPASPADTKASDDPASDEGGPAELVIKSKRSTS